MRKIAQIAGLLGCFAASLIARDASASNVDNPLADGSTTWLVDLNLPGIASHFTFTNGTGFSLVGAGSLPGTLLNDGTFTGDGTSNFPTAATGGTANGLTVLATLQVRYVSGAFDIRSGVHSIDLTMEMRVKFTSAGANQFGNSCFTSWKSTTVSTGKTWSGYTPQVYSTTDVSA